MNLPLTAPFNRLAMTAAALTLLSIANATACESPCNPIAPPADSYAMPAEPSEPSWIFRRSTFTNDPRTGARVAQYMRTPPVEPLDDPRAITSRYTRRRTNLRGTNGSFDTYYEVQNWGNGRGGLDAEWERFHDAWQDSFLQGGYFNQGPWGWGNQRPWQWGGHPGGWGPGNGPWQPNWGAPGVGFPGNGFPGGGFGPGPGYGGPGPGYAPDQGAYPPGYGQSLYHHGGVQGQSGHGSNGHVSNHDANQNGPQSRDSH